MSMFCFGSGVSVAVRVELELHEDEVPELEEALARRSPARSRGGRSRAPRRGRSTSRSRGRTGRGRRPTRSFSERGSWTIRSGGMPDPSPRLRCDLVRAEPELGVAGEDGHPEAPGLEPHVREHELPGELDRALLEVMAEREVAEHLEEREVVAVEPDLVDVGARKHFWPS